eukprot:CAMPEP_0204216294 /NCGR_PEP_ID=MMETSP0361-20130328/78063_1 /ASSEMBLY_ACC=CAM_ASM_000343 /TAXON_ID=268821 /ORGANISM="Scrippsiella Hangoei, Strain SHTV-5" /LENGTH=415 /DNA_ID=CAMNT_0051181139 /DNA_START=13 /DNA_END=1260 /DNA_ORIENTATION=-
MSALASRNLSNIAWACAVMLLRDYPLLSAISAESMRRIGAGGIVQFDSQWLANTSWAFARMLFRHPPLMDAIASAALTSFETSRQPGEQEEYALLWSIWRVGDPEGLLAKMHQSATEPGGTTDALVRGFLLAVDAWRHDAAQEMRLHAWISATLPPSALTRAACRMSVSIDMHHISPQCESRNPFYQRLARLLDVTSTAPCSAEGVLREIECFGHVSSWLKVAGDSKAEVLACAIERRPPLRGECTLELGAFVGYSAIRFARQVSALRGGLDLCGISLEIDPIHVAVSRHHLDRASLSTRAEIWVGQLQDTMFRAVEVLGCESIAFVFMDQRGTTFHEDLAQLERMQALAAASQCTADNTLKPGSPVYLWHVAVGAACSFSTSLWSMSEFALEAIEDWQAVSLLRGSRENSLRQT